MKLSSEEEDGGENGMIDHVPMRSAKPRNKRCYLYLAALCLLILLVGKTGRRVGGGGGQGTWLSSTLYVTWKFVLLLVVPGLPPSTSSGICRKSG